MMYYLLLILESVAAGKIGVITKQMNNQRAKVAQEAGLQWFMNWDPTMGSVTNAHGLEFIPEQWGVDNQGMAAPSGATQPIALMYNEPDTPTPMGSGLCKDGDNFSAAKAKQMAGDYCRQVKQFKGMGYQEIGSPAFSYTPTDQDFQNNCVLPFFEEVANDQECKEATNYFVWHMYTSCDSPAGVTKFCTDRTNDWADLMEKVELQFEYSFKGMYITEFAGWWEGCKDKGPQGTEGQAMVAEHLMIRAMTQLRDLHPVQLLMLHLVQHMEIIRLKVTTAHPRIRRLRISGSTSRLRTMVQEP
jgi:hypothetical protein